MNTIIHVDFQLKRIQSGPVASILLESNPAWSFEDIKERIRARFGSDMPKFVESAWKSKSNEPYRFGCPHNVKYRTVRPRYWNRPMPFPMDINPNSEVIGRDVVKGGSDPCAWMDLKYKVTLNHIRSRKGNPLTIHTRSDLIAHDDYVEAVDKQNHKIVMYLLDSVEEVVREQEPGAPSLKRRQIAISKLRSHGINVEVVCIPVSALKRKGGAA